MPTKWEEISFPSPSPDKWRSSENCTFGLVIQRPGGRDCANVACALCVCVCVCARARACVRVPACLCVGFFFCFFFVGYPCLQAGFFVSLTRFELDSSDIDKLFEDDERLTEEEPLMAHFEKKNNNNKEKQQPQQIRSLNWRRPSAFFRWASDPPAGGIDQGNQIRT